MELEPFLMERFQSHWEHRVRHNLAESGVHPLTLAELCPPADREALFAEKLAYVQTNGTEALRAAIASLYPGAGPDNVLVCNGTAEANHVCLWQRLEPGDEVVVMLPSYMQVPGLARGFGARVVPWWLRPEQDWVADLDALRARVTPRTRLIVLCNPNNPTGAVLSPGQMREVAAVAARHGTWLLADEVYRGAEADGVETPTFWGLHDRVLVTSGLSKAYGLPGLRIGWVVGPPEVVAELWGRRDYTTIAIGALSDFLARRALSPSRRTSLLERTRRILRENYPQVEGWVGSRPGLSLVPPRAGAIAFVRYAGPVASLELARRAREEEETLVVPGAHFEQEGYLRLGFGNEPEDLRGGLARLGRLFDRLDAGQ